MPESGIKENPFAAGIHALDRAWELGREWVMSLPDRPAGRDIHPAELDARFADPLPENGCDPAKAIDDWFIRAEPGITASSGPRNFAFVTGGTTPAALAADWLTSAIDQNHGLWVGGPAAAHTEEAAVRWLKQLFDLPPDWGCSITSGATMAHLVGLAVARQWASRKLGFDAAIDGLGGHPPIPVLSSADIHMSAIKSLSTLGFGHSSVRKLASTGGVLQLDALERVLSEIDGPVIVVANAAEVNTGAFDDLQGIADLCASHSGGAWMHVDAAFGIYARVSPRTAHLLDGIERADSVCCDAHKWLNVPYDSGFTFVRDRQLLLETFSTSAAYLDPAGEIGVDLNHRGPFASQRVRAIAIWCALRAYGRSGYREMVERCLDNASKFGAWIDANPHTELMAPVALNMVCWRYVVDSMPDDELDAFNRRAVSAIQRDGRALLTPTVWQGKQAIRCAFDNWATTAADVQILQEAVTEIWNAMLPG